MYRSTIPDHGVENGAPLKNSGGDFPGGPVVKTPRFQHRWHGFDPCWGTKILHALWHSQKILKRRKKEKKNSGRHVDGDECSMS